MYTRGCVPHEPPDLEAMRRLVELPLRKSVQMACQSIRVRFFRSLITTTSLILAVAFLAFTQSGNDIAAGLLASHQPSYAEALSKAGYDISPGTETIRSSAKQRWIVFLSLLVCVVGIVNAQLMSVTERFREIGTLKCLGALDRFIVRLFIIEAVLQGVTGAVAGALFGAGTALLTSLGRFGFASVSFLPWQELGATLLFAVGTGTLLSLLGVLYPAIVAARMQPVEAMRADY